MLARLPQVRLHEHVGSQASTVQCSLCEELVACGPGFRQEPSPLPNTALAQLNRRQEARLGGKQQPTPLEPCLKREHLVDVVVVIEGSVLDIDIFHWRWVVFSAWRASSAGTPLRAVIPAAARRGHPALPYRACQRFGPSAKSPLDLTPFPERVRRQAEHGLERAREMERVAEAGLLGHLFDQRAGLLQPLGGQVHFQSQQILIGALVVVPPEQPAEIGAVDVAFGGDLLAGS